ncbi:short-chain dehydrogenase [beta proteobacterium AAP99]|nr:short-chain dehydrogenase [beta proteobacterium AAP99]
MKSVLIVGASRGIGLEFATQYAANNWNVFATARDEAGLGRLRALGADALMLDVTDPAAPARLAERVAGKDLDLAIINAGTFGPRLAAPDAPAMTDFDAVMHTNVFGPMQMLLPVAQGLKDGGKLAVLSSKMGSKGARTSAGGWVYRASKAAVNSVVKDASIILAARSITCAAFHPGWVKTDMGGTDADLTVQESVSGLRHTFLQLAAEHNGGFFDYDGTPIPW